MKKNDWIVAGLNNPDFTNADFSNIADMTVDNTQLLSRDEYLKSNFIKENAAFRDQNGNFSEQKFDDYYNQRVKAFGEFQNDDFYKGPALDMFDTDRTPETTVQDIHFNVTRGVNPDRQAIGIEGVNVWSDPVFSQREIAKQNKVFNTETGEFEDYTVNDHSLVSSAVNWFKDLFDDPLVLATWDDDGEHIDPLTGVVKKHKKGEAKLNDKGTYYYETLGGRSVIGKDVLSVFDTFTVDGQGINKYDFFDSNDIDKSVTGTIAKNVAALLPMFCGPVVGGIYAGLMVAKEFGKSMPMLYGMATALSDSENPSWVNTLSALGNKFSSSTSDYAQQNTFSFENFGNLIADVALQWGQQKLIAQGFSKLKGAPNVIKEAETNAQALFKAKQPSFQGSEDALWKICQDRYLPQAMKIASQQGQLGRDMSLAYMAIVSNSDVYQDAIEHGTSKTEAAAIALGSTLGMFAVDKYAYLGKLFFDEATPDATKLARAAIKNEFASARNVFDAIKSKDLPARNKFMQYIKQAADVGKRALSKFNEDLKYHTTTLGGKMLGEGVEEVSEELVADTSKSLYELAGQLGFNTSVSDVGAWDNAFDRYAMSFLGGALGGGVFYGKEVWDGKTFHRPQADQDIATLIRNGHVDELRSQLAKLGKEGKAGSKTLSATDYEKTDDGTIVWKTTEDETQSQNNAVLNLVNDKITSIEEVLNNNRVNLSDDQLFDNMVLSEKRYQRYKDIAPLTNYYQDFALVLNKLTDAELAYKRAGNTMEGKIDGTAIPNDTALSHLTQQQADARQANLDLLKQNVDAARTNMQKFLAGETSLDYTRKLNFAMDPMLHSAFMGLDKESYLQTLYPGKTAKQLTPEEFLKFEAQQWPDYIKTQLKTKLSDAWEKFKAFETTVDPHLVALQQEAPQYKSWLLNLQNLFTSGALSTENLFQSYKKFDQKLDAESDEAFANRNKKIINPSTGDEETEEEFQMRKYARLKQIEAYNESQDKIWADGIMTELAKVNYQLDPLTARMIQRKMPERVKDTMARKIKNTLIAPEYKGILITLAPDLSNSQEVLNSLQNTIKTQTENQLESAKTTLEKLSLTSKDGESADFLSYIPNIDEGTSVNDILSDPETFVPELSDKSVVALQNALIGLLKCDIHSKDAKLQNALDTLLKSDSSLKDEERQNALKTVLQYDSSLGDTELADLETTLKTTLKMIEEYTNQQFAVVQNEFNSLLSDIKANPIIQLSNTLHTQIKNPIGELVKKVASANGDTVYNVEDLLQTIQDNYNNIDDVHQLQLNDAERENIVKVRNYLRLLDTYIYAASTAPTSTVPVGHNKTINTFAKNNSQKLTTQWNPLPEIDSDYATLYSQAINGYLKELDFWQDFSNKNTVDKMAKFARTDKALNVTLWNTLANGNGAFKVNGKEYDLLEGKDTIDTTKLDTDLAQIPTYNLERLVYKNFRAALKDSGLSMPDFLKQSRILETLIPGLSKLDNQKSSEITDALTKDKFTDYDKLIYYITLLSEDPATFYSALNQRVAANKNIAPLTVQEYTTRIAQASLSQDFKNMLTYAYNNMGVEPALLRNTTIISGVAGAGKTQVVLNAIDSALKASDVIIAGPTATQAAAMQKAMGRNSSMTFDDLMKSILGELQYNDIKAEINTTVPENENFDGKYITIKQGTDGLRKPKLKVDALKFQETKNPVKAIYLDEATHLSTTEAEIIDAYAQSIGAQVFMCGDFAQNGYTNPKSRISNIDESAVFAVRTPKLSISLRDNNLQKFQNQEAVRQVLETILEKRAYASTDDYKAFFPTAESLISKFNFKAYTATELNGDLITPTLSADLINQLKTQVKGGKTIAFIGSSSSPTLSKLTAAGIDIPATSILTAQKMQGQEFDYVVIDQQFEKPQDIVMAKSFVQNLYTLMTRAKEGSIFIDNGLSDVIGKGTLSTVKSKAPSIAEGVERLRNNKLEILKQLDLTPFEAPAAPEVKTEANPPINTAEDFNDPDKRETATAQKESINAMFKEDETPDEVPVINTEDVNGIPELPIECYGDVTMLDVVLGNEEEREGKNGKTYKAQPWKVVVPTEGELRNLQAIYPNGSSAFWYNDKIQMQRAIANVKSAILFQHTWPSSKDTRSLPTTITSNFEEADWKNGKYILEIREATGNEVLPIHGFKEAGMEYNGKRYIANIVFQVKNKQGRICKFDLAGINSPKTLIDKLPEIKSNLLAKIQNPKRAEEERQKLRTIYDKIDGQAQSYKNWFDEQLKTFEETGKYELDVSTAINMSQTSWFVKRKGPRIQLGGKIDPDTLSSDKIITLIGQNPDKVFSPIYTFTGNEAEFYNMDQSLKGKAVIFFTSDTLLEPDKLLEEYLGQKAYPSENTPRVRMLVLNNYGLTFSQLNDPEFIKNFQRGDEDRKPFRQNFTGMRMFTSLWNTRAALLNFNTAYNEWKKNAKYSDDQVNALLKADYQIFKGNDATKALTQSGLSQADLDNLHTFNEQTCKDIPMFRLGYSDNDNGFHIQRYNVKDSTAYEMDEANLCAITPAKAAQFYGMVSNLMEYIVPRESKSLADLTTTLGLELLKKDANGNMVKWEANEYIDFEDANHQRTLSGLLSKQDGQIVVSDGQMELAYAKGEQWSMIPRLISNYSRTIAYYQYNPESDSPQNLFAKVSFKTSQGTAGTEETKTLEMDIQSYFGKDGWLKESEEIKDDNGNVVGHTIDNSLFDMFNLIFHGTIEDIHRKYSKEHPLMQMTDAYYKEGFYINPDISRKKDSAGATDISQYTNEKGEAIFFEIGTNEELFTVDVDLRNSGVQLYLPKLINLEPERARTATADEMNPTDKWKQEHPDLVAIIDRVNSTQGKSYQYEDIDAEDAISDFNDGAADRVKIMMDKSPENLLTTEYKFEGDGIITYGEYLTSKIGEFKMTNENGRIELQSKQGTFIISQNNIEPQPTTTVIEEKSVSRFEQDINDKKLGNVVMQVLNNKDFQNAVREYSENENEAQVNSDIQRFITRMLEIIDLGKTLTDTEDKVIEKLNSLLGDDSFGSIIGVLYDTNATLYERIFENCNGTM